MLTHEFIRKQLRDLTATASAIDEALLVAGEDLSPIQLARTAVELEDLQVRFEALDEQIADALAEAMPVA